MDKLRKEKIIGLTLRHQDAPDTGLLINRIIHDVAERVDASEDEMELLSEIVVMSLITYAEKILIETEGLLKRR